MLLEAVITGMCVSLILTETMGLAVAGIVVPGYLALILHDPVKVIGIMTAGIITYLIVRLLSLYLIIYGRRLLIISILIGFVITYFSPILSKVSLESLSINPESVGFIIPGLIAYWFERQGVVPTLCSMIIVSCLVRLVIIIIHNGAAIP